MTHDIVAPDLWRFVALAGWIMMFCAAVAWDVRRIKRNEDKRRYK